jgi:hypothetical protein
MRSYAETFSMKFPFSIENGGKSMKSVFTMEDFSHFSSVARRAERKKILSLLKE